MKRLLIGLSLLAVILGITISFLSYQEENELVSPLSFAGKTLGVDLWFPQPDGLIVNAPKINTKAAYFVETSTGQVLYSKNSNEKLPIASLAKVMTALIALEHRPLDDKFRVSKRASEMEPDEMILLPGEALTLKELLYGIFLISANDAAEVLAEEVTGNREEFMKLMNNKALELEMKNTYFANPTGLDEDFVNSYSSAYDLVILTRYLIRRFPEVVEISKTKHIIIPRTFEHQDYEMYSGINLLTTYPGVVGFKTGYTPEAGLTLITLARKSGHDLPAGRQEVLGVLLGSENRRDEARELLDYSFRELE